MASRRRHRRAGVRWAGVGRVDGRASTGRVSSDTGRAVPDGCRAGTGSGERPVAIGPPRDEYVPDKCPSGSPGNPPAKFGASPQVRAGERGLSHILSDGTVGARRRGRGVTARSSVTAGVRCVLVAPRSGCRTPSRTRTPRPAGAAALQGVRRHGRGVTAGRRDESAGCDGAARRDAATSTRRTPPPHRAAGERRGSQRVARGAPRGAPSRWMVHGWDTEYRRSWTVRLPTPKGRRP